MASRKEERERLRAERERAETAARAADRKRLIVGYVVAGLISAAVVAGIVVAIFSGGGDGSGAEASGDRLNAEFGVVPEAAQVDDRDAESVDQADASGDLTELAEQASCELLLDQSDEGANHLDPRAELPEYRSDPPTSGDHSPEPLADGAFTGEVPVINYLHALEHGRVALQYAPELSEPAQRQLLALFDESPEGMTLLPNEELPYELAATAWRNTLGCESFEGAATIAALRAFRDEYRGRGPEPVPLQ